MKKILYLHVGMHKTGSTAIQKFLHFNRFFLEGEGFLYPTTKYHPVGQQRLAYAFNESISPDQSDIIIEAREHCDELFLALKELLRKKRHHTLLISSENFSPQADVKVLKRIGDFFNDYEIRVVLYVRRQDRFHHSLYRETVKQPNSETCRYADFICPYDLNYENQLDAWSSVFGIENLRVRSYDNALIGGRGVIDDFCHVVGLSRFNLTSSRDVSNATLSNIALDLIRAANNINMSFKDRSYVNGRLIKFARDHHYDDVWNLDDGLPFSWADYNGVNQSVNRKYGVGLYAAFNSEKSLNRHSNNDFDLEALWTQLYRFVESDATLNQNLDLNLFKCYFDLQ
jgi:hypothetical protein